MKTTLELPDGLLRRTKAEAAQQGRSMKDLVIEALEERLRKKNGPASGWRVAFGRAPLAAVRDVDRRVADLERVHTEDW
jgi:plasmid stability protein